SASPSEVSSSPVVSAASSVVGSSDVSSASVVGSSVVSSASVVGSSDVLSSVVLGASTTSGSSPPQADSSRAGTARAVTSARRIGVLTSCADQESPAQLSHAVGQPQRLGT